MLNYPCCPELFNHRVLWEFDEKHPSRLAPIAKFSRPRSTSSGQALWDFSMVHANPELHPISAKLLGMFFFKTPTNSSS